MTDLPGSEHRIALTARARAARWFDAGDTVVVAVSGGVDSTALLHALRFGGFRDVRWIVAHFDHRMRPGSDRDAEWVRGLARGWGLDARIGTSPVPLSSEADARAARYAFLQEVRAEWGARWIVTAHHADDQAETVLHRVLRGTGPDGLVGVHEVRADAVLRPFLDVHRDAVVAYASAVRLVHRFDPTNLDRGRTRNRLRHDVLPALESGVAPGARKALVRLGQLAARDRAAWESVLDRIEADVVLGGPSGAVVADTGAFLDQHEGVRARLLRRWVGGLGVTWSEAALFSCLSALTNGGSAEFRTGGLVVERGAETFTLRVGIAGSLPELPDTVELSRATGTGRFRLSDRVWTARWEPAALDSGPWTEVFALDGLLPARLRGWRPGDRLRLPYGTKKLKKVFQERRIPRPDRGRTPILVGGAGRVLWIPGVLRSTDATPGPDAPRLTVSLEEHPS